MNRRHTHQTGVPLFLKTRQRLNSISIGEPDPDGGVAEIVAYNQNRQQAYVVNGKDGLLYRLDVSAEGLTLAENAVDLVEDEQYQPKTYPNALGVYMPEGLSFLNLDGKSMVLAACEVSGTVAAYAVEEGSSTPAAQQVMGQEPAGSAPSDALNGEETLPESAQQNQDVSNPSPVIGLVLVAVLAAVLCGLAVYKAKKTKEK